MSAARMVRQLVDVFSHEVQRHRALSPALQRVALVCRVRGVDGVYRCATCLVDRQLQILDGDVVPVGFDAVRITADVDAVSDLVAGRTDARALAASQRLLLEGASATLEALARCFASGETPISIRFQR